MRKTTLLRQMLKDKTLLVAPGAYDVLSVETVDEKGGWLYLIASPHNPTQRYLYRTRLDGGTPQRISPSAQPGWHT